MVHNLCTLIQFILVYFNLIFINFNSYYSKNNTSLHELNKKLVKFVKCLGLSANVFGTKGPFNIYAPGSHGREMMWYFIFRPVQRMGVFF